MDKGLLQVRLTLVGGFLAVRRLVFSHNGAFRIFNYKVIHMNFDIIVFFFTLHSPTTSLMHIPIHSALSKDNNFSR